MKTNEIQSLIIHCENLLKKEGRYIPQGENNQGYGTGLPNECWVEKVDRNYNNVRFFIREEFEDLIVFYIPLYNAELEDQDNSILLKNCSRDEFLSGLEPASSNSLYENIMQNRYYQ